MLQDAHRLGWGDSSWLAGGRVRGRLSARVRSEKKVTLGESHLLGLPIFQRARLKSGRHDLDNVISIPN